jgi:hypothetical protein
VATRFAILRSVLSFPRILGDGSPLCGSCSLIAQTKRLRLATVEASFSKYFRMSIEPIPADQRTTLLKAFLQTFISEMRDLQATAVQKQALISLGLHGIIYPWVVPEGFQSSHTEEAKATYKKYGVDGARLVKELDSLLDDDEHLRKCCVNVLVLAQQLDKFIAHLLKDLTESVPTQEEFDLIFRTYTDHLYEEPFAFLVFSHIFNFTADEDILDFGSVQIRKLAPQEIPILFGESTSHSLLHPYQSGQFFVVDESNGLITDDLAHIGQAHDAADKLVMIFQYFKDGVVHSNYSANFFRPLWLNRIRKYGSFYWGDNRRRAYELGERMYQITAADHAEIATWFELFSRPELLRKFDEPTKGLGKTIDFAGTYYRSSHTQVDSERKLIDLAIALESAFSPGNKDEITFQLSQFCAEFVGVTPTNKLELVSFVKNMYNKRSNLLHGNHTKYEKDPVTMEELEKFSSIIRASLLKFIALYLDGTDDHKEVINLIKESLFNPDTRTNLAERSDIHRVIASRLPSF